MNLPPLPRYAKNVRKGMWTRLIASFGYAFSGLWYALRTQRNMRIHATAAVMAITLGLLLHISPLEFAIIFVVIGAVLLSEMFNTAIELCVDLASPEYHMLAKIAKDVAAGAVLVCAIIAIFVALCIFGPRLWLYL